MLAARIITGVVFGVAITAALLLFPPPVTAAVLAVLWLAGVWEWAGFAKLELAGRVANAHREDGVNVSPGEQAALDEIETALR